MNKSNLISIDITRALAAFSVFSYHQHIGKFLTTYTKIGIFDYFDNLGAEYAVPLFFLISGYCIHLSCLKYIKLNQALPLKKYYKKRFLRIYPPYIFAVIVSVGVNLITRYNPLPSVTDILIHVSCLQGFTNQYFNTINLVLWTITVEVAFYIIYPIFYYFRLKYSLNTVLSIVFVVSALNIIVCSIYQPVALNRFFWVGNIWFAWCCGAFIADKLFFDAAIFSKPLIKLIYLVFVVLHVFLLYFPIHYLSILIYQLKILIWTAPLIYLISKEEWLRRQKSWLLKIVINIGLSSYSLYLLHQPLIILKNYLVYAYLPVQLQVTGMVLGVVLIPFISLLNYFYIEKPFMVKKPV